MCNKIVARKGKYGKVFTTTATEREARLNALWHITEEDLAECRQRVRRRVPLKLGDPEEALSAGLEIALKKYEGLGEVSAFVAACGYNRALTFYVRRSAREISFEEPQLHEIGDENESWAESLIGDASIEYIEPIDAELLNQIRRALANMINYKVRATRPTVIATALKILEMLSDSANRDHGIGIDEYDEAPLKAPDYRGQVHFDRNTKVARREMYRHLAERCGVDPYNVTYAMAALRKSTEIALRERKFGE